jgi:hypothetical protein
MFDLYRKTCAYIRGQYTNPNSSTWKNNSSQNEREPFDVLSTLYVQKLSVIDGNFGKNYTNQINSNSTIIYKFKYSEFKNQQQHKLKNYHQNNHPVHFWSHVKQSESRLVISDLSNTQ